MIENTINDDKTIEDGKDVILAGRYHIIRQLGQGGMGSVWLAEDRQLDNRKVAIKMLPSIIVTDKRAYQQLKSEALVSLKLIHPNIVTLRAFEENEGAPFLVMDYIEGQTLSDYLAEKGKLSEAETIKLLKPIAAALDYAHGEKVIHRDVKPSNIIIRNDGHPFILDFGIAREIQESMTRVTGRTISGTLLYMSPEQLRGAPPTPAQDIYSFAAMCYECLSGNPPFTKGEIAYQILNDKPAPLIGQMQFVMAVMAGLAKRPEERPNDCMLVLPDEDDNIRHYPRKALSKHVGMLHIVMGVAIVAGIVAVGIYYITTYKDKRHSINTVDTATSRSNNESAVKLSSFAGYEFDKKYDFRKLKLRHFKSPQLKNEEYESECHVFSTNQFEGLPNIKSMYVKFGAISQKPYMIGSIIGRLDEQMAKKIFKEHKDILELRYGVKFKHKGTDEFEDEDEIIKDYTQTFSNNYAISLSVTYDKNESNGKPYTIQVSACKGEDAFGEYLDESKLPRLNSLFGVTFGASIIGYKLVQHENWNKSSVYGFTPETPFFSFSNYRVSAYNDSVKIKSICCDYETDNWRVGEIIDDVLDVFEQKYRRKFFLTDDSRKDWKKWRMDFYGNPGEGDCHATHTIDVILVMGNSSTQRARVHIEAHDNKLEDERDKHDREDARSKSIKAL